MYADNCPTSVRVRVRVRVSFRLGAIALELSKSIFKIYILFTTAAMLIEVSGQLPPEENCLPSRVGIWLRVSFGVGRQFSSRAIVLDPLIE